jgi:CheY-like chemotaxis protein/HPt (histidine-containing phosphotransfer) domain-containing protein
MGGHVGVNSTAGQGAHFWLEVSLEIAPTRGEFYGHDQYSDDLSGISNNESQWLRGLQLLIVDDARINLEVISRVLQREGAGTTCCQSGEEALEKLTTPGACYDAILMDLQMPGLDGCETTLEIRQRLQLSIPIIALTAGATTTEQDRAMASGMDDFLTKPVDTERLFGALRQHIQGERQHIHQEACTPNVQPGFESRDIDLARIVNLFGEDRDFFSMLCEAVATDMREAEPQLRRWLADDALDREQIAQFAHKQKGQFANIGAQTVSDAAHNLEQAAKAGSIEDVRQAMLDFEAAYRTFFEVAAQWLQNK